jgi:hypothetical protein
MKREIPSVFAPASGRLLAAEALMGLVALICLAGTPIAWGQTPARWKVHAMDRPRPPVVTPANALPVAPPSDARVLFDGSDVSQWRSDDGGPAKWIVKDGYMESVRGSGYVFTRDSFGDIQLHVEWAAPTPASGSGQGRGNSGVFLMGLYEVQVLDSYNNVTYTDGQAGAVYGQYPPLANASRPPGEWQSYDIIFRRPRFLPDGSLVKPARITVLHNGILVQDTVEAWGPTKWLKHFPYESHPDKLPISLQDHGNPVRYRNIWLRELPESTSTGPVTDDTKPLITLMPNVLDLYVGKYQLQSRGALTISREGSRLFMQILEVKGLELLPHSTKEFSLRWTDASLVFDLNEQAAPTGVTFHIGGDELRAKKID